MITEREVRECLYRFSIVAIWALGLALVHSLFEWITTK